MWRRQIPERRWTVILASALIAAGAAWACGPDFPNQLLLSGDEAVLWAPVADFHSEIKALLPTGRPRFPAVVPGENESETAQTDALDRAELAEVLAARNLSASARSGLIAEYGRVRAAITARVAARAAATGAPTPATLPPLNVAVPAGLPPEFDAYLRGALAYHRGERDAARQAWEALLALPEDQRRHRSTWAVYMLGRMALDDDPTRAVQRFREVRALVRAGFADRLGLAAASLGDEARIELRRKAYGSAATLYVEQLHAGDPSAANSLRVTAGRLIADGATALRSAARNELLRRLVTAYLLAHGGPTISDPPDETVLGPAAKAWLEALAAADIRQTDGADRLAWAAYQAGRYRDAERWLARAAADAPMAQWIRAKLLLRAGKIEAAMTCLAAAAAAFPPDEVWSDVNIDREVSDVWAEARPAALARSELGVLKLSRRQYVDALDTLLRGGQWLDAAYVAERVLTIEELTRYVDTHCPAASARAELVLLGPEEGSPAARFEEFRKHEDEAAQLRLRFENAIHLRHLLARRMARLGRWSDAAPYFPRRYRAHLDEYARFLEQGRDTKRKKSDRASALWGAARVLRHHGLELVGSELDPDWACWDGQFESDPIDESRRKDRTARLVRASPDELARARRHATAPAKRYHYRYLAADLAWQAAAWMPDQSDETARVLCEAGSWLKGRDPQAANRFHKSLVDRCGRTALGLEARRLKWFPPLD